VVLLAGAAAAGLTGARVLTADRAIIAPDAGVVPIEDGRTSPRSVAVVPAPARAVAPGRRPPPPVPASVPARLWFPASRTAAPVVPIGVRPGGGLALPDHPATVGWWSGSAPAGAGRGSTVLAGHVDSAATGVGALAALRTAALGDRITVVDQFGGRHDYLISARRTYPKYALPRDVFATAGRARLVLITCGGPFDEATREYRDNLVVYALPG
jgi:Sortase domain